MFSYLYSVVRRELYRMSKNFVLLFIAIIGPIFIFAIIYWMFSAGVVRNMPVALVDQDATATSRKISRLCNTTPAITFHDKITEIGKAKDLMNKGKVDAILFIPDGTEQLIFKGEQASVNLYINNTNLVKAGVIKSGLYKTLASISAGIKIQVYQKKGATYHQAFENAVPVSMHTKILFNPFGNYSFFLALGLFPLMITIFTFLGSLYVVGIELKEGSSGELMETAGHSVLIAIIGKLLPYTFLFFVNAMIMNIILFRWLGTPLQGSVAIIIFSELLLIIAYQCVAVFFLALTANLRFSLSLGSAYTMMALSFSGLTFPTLGMPVVAKIIGAVFPYTIWLKTFIGQSLKGEPVQSTSTLFISMMIFILIGIASMPLLGKKLSLPAYWGKQ